MKRADLAGAIALELTRLQRVSEVVTPLLAAAREDFKPWHAAAGAKYVADLSTGLAALGRGTPGGGSLGRGRQTPAQPMRGTMLDAFESIASLYVECFMRPAWEDSSSQHCAELERSGRALEVCRSIRSFCGKHCS